MARLRSPDGCPWDRDQDLHSLRSFLIEEAYEVLEAIEQGDENALREELGDVLFQIVFQCQLASEQGWFDIDNVIDGIARKITRRHPHVFGKAKAETPAEVVATWERVKKEEKKQAGKSQPSALDGLPRSLPALLFAQRLSERAARVGFDWRDASEVMSKVTEELEELRQALDDGKRAEIEWELGDLFFALTNLARHLDLSAEDLVRACNMRFDARFRLVEKIGRERGIDLAAADIETLESLWGEAKETLAKT